MTPILLIVATAIMAALVIRLVMRPPRSGPIIGLALCLAVLAPLSFSACGGCAAGPAAARAERGLGVALAATNAARAEFLAWDQGKQAAIVAAAPSFEAGAAELARHRARREPIARAFVVAYSALAAGAALIPIVRDRPSEIPQLVTHILAAERALDSVRAALSGASP